MDREEISRIAYQSAEKYCPAGLIELKNSLKRELEDERTAWLRYREAAAKMTHYKKPVFADHLRSISDQEFMHRAILEGIIDSISEECGEYPELKP